MGGFHIFDLIVIALVGLAIFGPRALQSMARSAGKGLGQVKEAKDKVMSELPLEELSRVSQKVPTNPQQAIQMLITPEEKAKDK
jgi:Sec-independent protein translocase protein TatA